MLDFTGLSKRGRRGAQAVILGVSLGAMSACDGLDGLLEVELPHLLTDAAIAGQTTAETQVNSVIALFECGYTAFGLTALGSEDAMASIAGVFSGGHVYNGTSGGGTCDTSDTSAAWFDQIMGARALVSTAPSRLVADGLGTGQGVYDRIQDDWSLGRPGERLSAISAIYAAASLTHLGEFQCEIAIDGSDLMGPNAVLDIANAWVTRAEGHITTFGDFAMPNGAASSARNMALSVRARLLWAKQDLSGAAAAAATVLADDSDFTAWVTREAGPTRRNKIYTNATSVGFSQMLGPVTFWNSAIRAPNPATGAMWPAVIPFTGYIFLAIGPDGETLEDVTDPVAGHIPVRYAVEGSRDASEVPTFLAGFTVADADTRVLHFRKTVQGPGLQEVPNRYSDDADDVPYMTWEELQLIIADNELRQGNLQNAIDIVNVLRADKGLQVVQGAYETTLLTDSDYVRALLLEERRRELFAEGARYYSTKIQNTDMLWFPRLQGETEFQGYNLRGGVRLLFGSGEYEGNPLWRDAGGIDLRATGCTTLGSMFGNPGSQEPAI